MLALAHNAAWKHRDSAAAEPESEPFVYRLTPTLIDEQPYALLVAGQVVARLDEQEYRRFTEEARDAPVEIPLARSPNVELPPHAYWQYEDAIYLTDEDLGKPAEVLARIRAHQRVAAERPARPPQLHEREIGLEVKQAVWLRDGGRCQSCSATYDLQFHRIIPAALGGSRSVENLQVLCDACIARSGDLAPASPIVRTPSPG